MEEILIVDRIENGYAVCETEQGEKKDIPLSETKDVHEGDVLILKDGVYIPDKDKTEARKAFWCCFPSISYLSAPSPALCHLAGTF